MVVASVQHWAALFAIHGFHTCYHPRYLSNEVAVLKETFLLLFPDEFSVAPGLFANHARFLSRSASGISGEMQVFENLPAEAKE